jgi:hypothetical protein
MQPSELHYKERLSDSPHFITFCLNQAEEYKVRTLSF